MRVMAYAGSLVALIAVVGAWFYRRRTLERHRWFLWTAVAGMALPFIAALAGWVLTEVGRQPWIVYGLLRTSQAASPSVGSATIITSLVAFAALYVGLGTADVYLMRKYARPEREPGAPRDDPLPAATPG
jgi:cytochrome d ubiquinol oxidase subunit I